MKRFAAFLLVILCLAVGPAVARDILVVPIPSGGTQYGSTATTAAVFSSLLTDIAADMALKAARDHAPVAVSAFRKHGPALLKTMRIWSEAALSTGGRYAMQTWSGSKKFAPQLVTGSKDLGLNAVAVSTEIVQEGFRRFLGNSGAGSAQPRAERQTSSRNSAHRSPKKTSGSGSASP